MSVEPAEIAPVAAPTTELNGTTPPTEPEVTPAQTPEEQRMASRFAALTRREKAAVEQEKSAKAMLEQVKQEQAKFQPIVDALAKGKENPQAILDAAGITLNELIQYHLKNGQPQQPEDKLTALERRIEEREKAEKEAQAAREKADIDAHKAYVESMIDSYRTELHDHIAANPDEYELILAHDAQDEVFKTIVEHYSETGKILSPAEASAKFEADLLESATKLLGLKKLSARLKPEPPKAQETQPPTKPPTRVVPKSLSNTQTMSDPVTKPERPMTREERLKAAAAKLQFVDKSSN